MCKRGAKNVTFIDNDVVALGITRENIIKTIVRRSTQNNIRFDQNSKKRLYFCNIL